MSIQRWWWVAVFCTGCAQSALVRRAEQGGGRAVRQEVQERLRQGTLGRAEARELARASLARELREARGDDAVSRVRDAETCLAESEPMLRERARGTDAAAAEALYVLYEGGRLSRGAAFDFEHHPDPAFQRLAVRALDRPEDHDERLRAFASSSGPVRIAALRAAILAADPREIPQLLERARLDPEPFARTYAVRALAVMERVPADLAAQLAALYVDADDAVQADIAVAWALSPLYERGGEQALLRVFESAKPSQRVQSALLLLRMRATEDLGQRAVPVVLAAIDGGTRFQRLLALSGAPLGVPVLREAVLRASRDADAEVRMAALERLASTDPAVTADAREQARAALYEQARFDGAPGTRARLALARAGDRRVHGWLEHDLTSTNAARRWMAAQGLAALGIAGRAASLLGDDDPGVRTRSACLILRS